MSEQDLKLLQGTLDVLVLKANFPLAVGETLFEFCKPVTNRPAVFIAHQFLCCKHLRMRLRSAHVIRHEARIQQVVLSRREHKYSLIEWQAFFPKPGHESDPLDAASAAVNAAMSLTTSVPFPSLVNISSRILSAAL